jgi:hypothetical protein
MKKKRFIKGQKPPLLFQKALKKPIPVECCQIDEPFEVETLEGVMKGKAGDWLMIGIKGEMWLCDKAIFEATYELIQ